MVCVWDWTTKKRISLLRDFGAPVSSLAFSPTGELLAVAASYGWEQGAPETLASKPPADAIFVRTMAEAEVKPKGGAA